MDLSFSAAARMLHKNIPMSFAVTFGLIRDRSFLAVVFCPPLNTEISLSDFGSDLNSKATKALK